MGVSVRIAVAGLLLSASVAIVVVATTAAGQSTGGTLERNGLAAREVPTLWSRDAEGGPPDQLWIYREVLNWTGATPADVTEARTHATWQEIAETEEQSATLGALTIALNGDVVYGRPPTVASQWTTTDFDDLKSFDYSRNASIYPDEASPVDGRFVADAHATLYAVDPSTTYHGQRGETRYVAPEGTANGLVDYRVAVPEDYVVEPNASRIIERWHNYSYDASRVNRTWVLADGATVGSGGGSHRPALDYELTDREIDRLTLRAEINVSIEHTTHERVWEEYSCDDPDTPWNETCYREEWERPETVVETETMTVNHTTNATRYDLSPRAWLAARPDGRTRLAVGADGVPIAGYRAAGDRGVAGVRSDVRFYTARDTGWDRLTITTAENVTEIDSPARPVRIHAYRDRAGAERSPEQTVQAADPGDDTTVMDAAAIRSWGPTRQGDAGATVGEDISIVPVDGSTRVASRVGAVHPGGIDRIRVRGLVGGSDRVVDGSAVAVRSVRNLRIDAEVRSQSDDETTVHVRLVDAATGRSVALDSRPGTDATADANGHVEIEGEGSTVVRTDADGEFTRTVPGEGSVEIRYVRTAWAAADPAAGWAGPVYRNASRSVGRGVLDGEMFQLVLFEGIVLALPILFLYVLIDRGWRLFDFERKP